MTPTSLLPIFADAQLGVVGWAVFIAATAIYFYALKVKAWTVLAYGFVVVAVLQGLGAIHLVQDVRTPIFWLYVVGVSALVLAIYIITKKTKKGRP